MLVERGEIKMWVRNTLILTSGSSLIHWLTVEWHKKPQTFTSFVGVSFKNRESTKEKNVTCLCDYFRHWLLEGTRFKERTRRSELALQYTS